MNIGLVVLLVAAETLIVSCASTVTHEEIREAILGLVRIFRDSGDKLERHEMRERHLGDQLKKSLAGLDKKHRASDQSLDGITKTLKLLDERLQNIENSEAKREEHERAQSQKTINAMENIQESIQTWIKHSEEVMRSNTPGERNQVDDKGHIEALEARLITRVDHLASTVESLKAHILKVSDSKISQTEAENLRATSANLASTDSKWRKSLEETERVLRRYEVKLAELQESSVGMQNLKSGDLDWHSIFLTALESQQRILLDLKHMTQNVTQDVNLLPNREEVQRMTNSTQELMQEIRYELASSTDMGVAKLEMKLTETNTDLAQGQEELLKSVTEAGVVAEGLYKDVTHSYDQLLKEVQGLAKVEQVLIQTADNVLDTKRRIEYGVQQILLEVGDLVKMQAKDLNATLNRRFDDISSTILDNQNGALTNLSSKIETEISQVWRQIGIMYQQLTASAGALDRLQMQTEIYVNGSLQTMDSMEGKVGQITGRMSEVDENLNYLLGRLSLVGQEFNLIKSGLATALDNIRNSFIAVKDQIKDVGPGPNPIPEVQDASNSNESKDKNAEVGLEVNVDAQ